MIKVFTIALLLSNFGFALEWENNLDDAITKAKKEHKNMMVMVTSSSCGWCTKMKKSTLSDKSIEKRLEKYIVVNVSREDRRAMSQLPSVGPVPTIFFMKEDKTVIEDIIGYFNVKDFTFYIDDVERRVHVSK